MGIGSVKPVNGMAGVQGAGAQPVDSVSKNIEKEIANVQGQMQRLSSKEDMPPEEKVKKRQELQQELSSLNTQLRQRQAEVRKGQRREALTGETRVVRGDAAEAEKGRKTAGETEGNKTAGGGVKRITADARGLEKSEEAGKGGERKALQAADKDAEREHIQAAGKEETDNRGIKPENIGISRAQMYAIVAGDSAGERMKRREAVIARMEGGIVILKGEIRQDEIRGADTEKKRVELEKQRKKAHKAASGLPDLEYPRRSAGKARVQADRARKKSEANIIQSGRDGIVIATPNISMEIVS